MTCPVTILAPGASTTCTQTYVLTQADADSGHVSNTVTATGTPPVGAAVTGTDSTESSITPQPSITVSKSSGTPTVNAAGRTIAYTFVITNSGNVTLTAVALSDPKVGPVTCPVTDLVAGAVDDLHGRPTR